MMKPKAILQLDQMDNKRVTRLEKPVTVCDAIGDPFDLL